MGQVSKERARLWKLKADKLERELKAKYGNLVPREVMQKRLAAFREVLGAKIRAARLPAVVRDDLLAEVADLPRYLDGRDGKTR
jgi:hypothetical protein